MSESITNFLRWAEERLARAVEEDERTEGLAGTRDYLPEPKTNSNSLEDKIETINNITDMRSKGGSLKSALAKNKIHMSTYRRWLKLVK